MGFEPTTFGTTIRHSNQLSYIHHIRYLPKAWHKGNTLFAKSKIFEINFFEQGNFLALIALIILVESNICFDAL